MAAAVIVANPVAPPVRDFQISTTELSTNPQAAIPFDKNLLKSISQPSAASTFDAALAQILGALAAQAQRIGTEVTSDLSTPLTPASQTPTVNTPSSAEVPPGATPNGTPYASAPGVPAAVAANPTLQQVVSDLTSNTEYLGNNLVQAAYAAVDALVNTPDLIYRAVKAVLAGDLMTAFKTIVQAVKAYINPGAILVGAVDDLIDKYVLPPAGSTATSSTVATNTSHAVAPPATAAGDGTSTTGPGTTTAAPGIGKPRQTKSTGSARHAADGATSSINRPQLTPGSSASSPATGNPSPSVDPAGAAQSKPKAAGTDTPGSASAGRSQTAGGRGASAGN